MKPSVIDRKKLRVSTGLSEGHRMGQSNRMAAILSLFENDQKPGLSTANGLNCEPESNKSRLRFISAICNTTKQSACFVHVKG